MTERCLNGVRATFSAAHYSPEGDDHGHDYEVWAYFEEGEDARTLKRHLVAKLEDFDHRRLPDGLIWDNQLARHIGLHVGAVRVRVIRPVIGFEGLWEDLAIATEAATAAETTKIGSVHEGAGLKGIAQTPYPSTD